MSAAVMHNPGTYTFASQPRAVSQKKKFRPQNQHERYCFCRDEPPEYYGNIMHDKRVVRGSNYARSAQRSGAPDSAETQQARQTEVNKRKEMARRRKAKQEQEIRRETPAPVEGRLHVDVQTELYLEELTDRVEETEVSCQTDEFLDRPPTPLYRPAKTGLDAATQIEDGELFDFNLEAQPVLDVLVGKTMEQALLEVQEEEELADLREQQRQFEQMRQAELCEFQRLEEQDRRYREEKARRVAENEEKLRLEKESNEKLAALAFAQGYISDLIPSVFNNLDSHGYFYDPVEKELEKDFMPWLEAEVEKGLAQRKVSRKLVDSIIREITRNRSELFKELDKVEMEQAKQDTATKAGDENKSRNASPEKSDRLEGEEEEEQQQQVVEKNEEQDLQEQEQEKLEEQDLGEQEQNDDDPDTNREEKIDEEDDE